MSAPTVRFPHDPYAALRLRTFRNYLAGSFISTLGRQAVVAAATWQVYQWTHSATALGLVGLVNVLPLLGLSLPAGAIADRYDRRRLVASGTALLAVLNAALAALALWHDAIPHGSLLGWINRGLEWLAHLFERDSAEFALRFEEPALPLVYLLLLAQACVRILIWPARASIAPLLVPAPILGNVITWSTSAFEIATVAGPALGGLLIAYVGIPPVYVLGAVLDGLFVLALGRVTYLNPPQKTPGKRS